MYVLMERVIQPSKNVDSIHALPRLYPNLRSIKEALLEEYVENAFSEDYYYDAEKSISLGFSYVGKTEIGVFGRFKVFYCAEVR